MNSLQSLCPEYLEMPIEENKKIVGYISFCSTKNECKDENYKKYYCPLIRRIALK